MVNFLTFWGVESGELFLVEASSKRPEDLENHPFVERTYTGSTFSMDITELGIHYENDRTEN